MALDQIHEQNNKYVKGVSGATSLVNRQDDSALVRWALCGPELRRLIDEFEETFEKEDDGLKKHHEDNETFQVDFFNDVENVLKGFPSNPFQLNNLTVVNNTDIAFEDNIYYNLAKLESTGSLQLQEFIKTRLIFSKVSINTKITLNHFILPGDEKSKKPRGSLVDKRLSLPFLTKLRAAITYRRNHAQMLFKTEIFGTSQCLSINSETLYHGTKSNILQRFEKTNCPGLSPSSVIIIELSAILRREFYAKTFAEFALNVFNHILNVGKDYDRIDVVCDRYFEKSLKTQVRTDRGNGSIVVFNEESQFPTNFKDNCLKNDNNKERLNHFLADKFIQFHRQDKIFVVTKGAEIKTNDITLLTDPLISPCCAEEADQKLVRHMIQCVRSGMKKVVVRTVDTDVLILLLAYRHIAGNFESNVNSCFGVGANSCFYDINKIASQLGEKTCLAFPFFHAFTGCDTVSSLFNHGKCKLWDKWREFEETDALTQVFCELSEMPHHVSDEQITVLEKYILSVYYPRLVGPSDINVQRMRDFEHSTHNNLRLLPPSKIGLIHRVKRASYEAGWIAYQCVENVDLPDPAQWGWNMVNGHFVPKWQEIQDPIDALVVTATCSCVKQKCNNCQCSRQNLQCISFCKCQRNCQYSTI